MSDLQTDLFLQKGFELVTHANLYIDLKNKIVIDDEEPTMNPPSPLRRLPLRILQPKCLNTRNQPQYIKKHYQKQKGRKNVDQTRAAQVDYLHLWSWA